MSNLFRRNSLTIAEINKDFMATKFKIDKSYQRRKVWNDQDKVRLIETILLNLVMPEVFFWVAERDSDTGEAITHIVDGQQRITAIVDYINGEFCLTEKHLLDEEIKQKFANLYFKDLPSDIKNSIWEYPVSIVYIDSSCSFDRIKNMFYRLNLTDYSLNSQEKRNSKNSVFGDKCESLSTLDFWKNMKVFSSTDAKRMKDVEYCCAIYILASEGIFDQTNDRKINDYYDDYASMFDSDNVLTDKIVCAMDMIKTITDQSTFSFVSKKAQMFTLFCVMFQMIKKGQSCDKAFFQKFKAFVQAYNRFRNEFVIVDKDEQYMDLYEKINKYKLASSEGVNKIGNRVIRFEILYTICVDYSIDIVAVLENMEKDFSNILESKKRSFEEIEKDEMIDITD